MFYEITIFLQEIHRDIWQTGPSLSHEHYQGKARASPQIGSIGTPQTLYAVLVGCSSQKGLVGPLVLKLVFLAIPENLLFVKVKAL